MKDQFATYEVSKRLKELGFDEPCMMYWIDYRAWDKNKPYQLIPSDEAEYSGKETKGTSFIDFKSTCKAPLWQQVKQWLWEKHFITVDIEPLSGVRTLFKIKVYRFIKGDLGLMYYLYSDNSPITAEIEGITKAVEYLHKQLNP